MTVTAAMGNEVLSRLNWSGPKVTSGANGYQAVSDALEKAGMSGDDVHLIAVVMAYNGLDDAQMDAEVTRPIQLPSRTSFFDDWPDIARTRAVIEIVDQVGASNIREAMAMITPIVSDAQTVGLDAPQVPPGRRGLPGADLGLEPGPPPRPEVDRGRTQADAAVEIWGSDKENAAAWSDMLKSELRSSDADYDPDYETVGRLVQQIMMTGPSLAADRSEKFGETVDPRIAALEAYNRAVGFEPAANATGADRFALIADLRKHWGDESPELLIAMAFIRNESGRFENEDYVHFLFMGWPTNLWWWGRGERSLEQIYSSLRNPTHAGNVADELVDIERVNRRYIMKYGHTDGFQDANGSRSQQRLFTYGLFVDDPNEERRAQELLRNARPPLSVLAADEFGSETARRLRVLPYADRVTAEDIEAAIAAGVEPPVMGEVTAAYEVAMAIAFSNDSTLGVSYAD
ncbi:MAG: hypothetical protein AAF658_12680, partial [Myxococcota bacterium]